MTGVAAASEESESAFQRGVGRYEAGQHGDAIAAFREAAKTERSRRISSQWVRVIESDIQRNEQIRLAEAAAQKQLRELASRRRSEERI